MTSLKTTLLRDTSSINCLNLSLTSSVRGGKIEDIVIFAGAVTGLPRLILLFWEAELLLLTGTCCGTNGEEILVGFDVIPCFI